MKVYLLGAGPGDPSLLTLKARDILASADVVVYDALASPSLLAHCRGDAEILYVGKIAGNHALPQPQINELLIAKAREGKIVARLKGGDPYIFGRGGEEALALLEAGIPFEEVPGISSTIAAPAYAGIPLTHRDLVSSVTLITGHEKAEKTQSSLNWQALAQSGSTLVFVMGMKNLPQISEQLMAAGLAPQTPSALVYRGTTPAQRSLVAPLKDLPAKAAEAHFTNPSVIVVGQVVSLKNELNWFEKRPLFGKSIVVTRAREQASDIVASFSQLGSEVIQCPTIRIAPLPDYRELDAAIRNLENYQWLFFTSANGVAYFWQRLTKLGFDARKLGSLSLCAIGPGTAKALAEHGLKPDLIPQRFVAESLVQDFLALKVDRSKPLLLVRAKEAREVLPERLRASGYQVDVLPCYETLPDASQKELVEERLNACQLSCITFASSSTVRNFLKLVPAETLRKHPEVRLAAIGPITAKALQEAGLSCHIQPDQYTIKALISAVTADLSQH
ncbi:MAG: uroporphyrinogen-III C-methyltransferase [Desulfovibrio sp.]|nr:uroporphyrinogen-III C-methyltransferase [Desulfovibrio sp.]